MTIIVSGTKKEEVCNVEMGLCMCKRASEGILVYLAATDLQGNQVRRYLYDMEEKSIEDAIYDAKKRVEAAEREGEIYVGDLWEE